MNKPAMRKAAGSSLVLVALAGGTFYRIATHQLNLATGILFLGAVWWFLVLLAECVMALFQRSQNVRNNVRVLLASTALALLALELFLRFGLGKYANYYELTALGTYRSVVTYGNTTWFHVHPANTRFSWQEKEFIHSRSTNSLGLAEVEIGPRKLPGEFRIVALGDSYTEGIGTSYDSTWVKVVERQLAQRFPDRKITTINAGISGADPFSEYVLLREKLLSLQPDLVIVAVNHSDVGDIIIRGGMERFQPDGSLKVQRTAPVWDPIYGISYIFRLLIHDVFGYNWLLVSPEEAKTTELDAIGKIRLAFGLFATLARVHHFRILFVFHPQEFEVRDGRFEPVALDWLAHQSWSADSSPVIDLLEQFQVSGSITKENSAKFFWATDLHMNARGYAVMGDAIAKNILALRLLDDAGTR